MTIDEKLMTLTEYSMNHKIKFKPISKNQSFSIIGDDSIPEEEISLYIDEDNPYYRYFQEFIKYDPTYYIWKEYSDEEICDNDVLIDWYENIIAAIALIRSDFHNKPVEIQNNIISNINKILKWLRGTDFYTAPASTIYHESFRGGLLYHTYNVVYNIRDLLQLNKFKNIDIASAVLIACVHDWCKIGLYEQYSRNVKNADTGRWEAIDAFKRKDFAIPLGHGVQSMYIANKFFKLDLAECLAIRWHMGRWNVSESEVNEFQQANEQYPLVHMLQFADQLAITAY